MHNTSKRLTSWRKRMKPRSGDTVRAEFAQAMIALFHKRKDLVFITGDVGYMALEGIAEAYGERFINAGIAEQNAVSLAAGVAREGHLPWVYSSAPFVVLRPYEQIRNDVCLHSLPVKLVGNGGGYGFGIMGATHHALEDVGAMRVLPNMRIYVPLTAEDVPQVVDMMAEDPLPNYLRLNSAVHLPEEISTFAPWRRIKRGRGCIVIGMGPVVGNLYEMSDQALLDDLEIWSVGTFPLDDLPADLVAGIREKRPVVTIEEHYRACGLGEALSHLLLTRGVFPQSFTCLHADGYPSGRYGSQRWHQEENGLAGHALRSHLHQVIHG
jgi:transketolase